MDNLTHSLIGAALGQAGLKLRTGLAMPALIIGANLPDVDAPCTVYGVEALAMRRGITHGPIALLILPLLLAGLLIAFDRWQTRRGKRPAGRLPVHAGWLVALCYLGALSHPLFDWFNTYGIRLLEPFSSRWFYGDTLFIIDIWIWAMLGLGLWQSRRREGAGASLPARPARVALGVMAGYIGLNMAISQMAAFQARYSEPYPQVVVAQPVPLAFWQRTILWRNGERHGAYDWSAFSRPELRQPMGEPTHMADPRIAAWASHNPAATAFLFWSRMPVATPVKDGILLTDQRFASSPMRGAFVVKLEPER